MFRLLVPKLKYLYDEYKGNPFTILDVGCGNHSASIIKSVFKNSKYYGIDKENYNNSDDDLKLMEKFYKIDLEYGSYNDIPDNSFDVIMLAHVIEHISNGLSVVEKLMPKLKKGGVIYIEFPSVKSLNFPSMKGTLHFCDDPTHKRLYDVKEISNLLLANGFKIIKAGNLRDPVRIILFPAILISSLIRGTIGAGTFWYVLGFPDFVFARKNSMKEL